MDHARHLELNPPRHGLRIEDYDTPSQRDSSSSEPTVQELIATRNRVRDTSHSPGLSTVVDPDELLLAVNAQLPALYDPDFPLHVGLNLSGPP